MTKPIPSPTTPRTFRHPIVRAASLVWLLALPQAVGQDIPQAWLAQVGHGEGFETELVVVNLRDSARPIEIATFDSQGEPLALLHQANAPAAAVINTTVAARGSLRLTSSGNPDVLTLGWARIDGDVSTEATLRIVDLDSQKVTSRVSVSAGGLFRRAVLAARATPPVRTGIALLSPRRNPAPAAIRIRAVSEAGQPLFETQLELAPGVRISRFMDELIPGVQGFSGTLEVDSTFPLRILPLRQQGVVLSSLQLLAARSLDTVDDGCGAFGDWRRSDYLLPFPPGTEYRLNQGNCSGFGHSGFWRFGYDFIMPIGTTVTAARAGIVIAANDGAANGNPNGTNLVTVRHVDGTVALYSHLTPSGVLVDPGDRVEAGQIIGLSGNTGNTGGLPHLHFSLHPCGSLPGLAGKASCPTLPVTFRNTDPNPTGLQAGRSYSASDF